MLRFGRFLALASLLAACSSPKPVEERPATCGADASAALPPDADGPFHTGYRHFDVTYQPPGVDGPRKIAINVWYPTRDEAGEGARYLGLQNDDQSFVDATVAEPLSACGFPVVVYSHGFAAYGGNASFLMRHFASHGWVAVAPDHTLNTLLDRDRPPEWIQYVRSLDITRTLDELAALPATDPLAGKLSLKQVVMVGHSFGAFTAWATAGAAWDVAGIQAKCDAGGHAPEACSAAAFAQYKAGVRDPRVIAAVPMAGSPDGDWFGDSGGDAVRIPILELSGSKDQRGIDALYAATTTSSAT
jgi:predicted dienelactone hydrolase